MVGLERLYCTFEYWVSSRCPADPRIPCTHRAALPGVQHQVWHQAVVPGDWLAASHHMVLQVLLPALLFTDLHARQLPRVSLTSSLVFCCLPLAHLPGHVTIVPQTLILSYLRISPDWGGCCCRWEYMALWLVDPDYFSFVVVNDHFIKWIKVGFFSAPKHWLSDHIMFHSLTYIYMSMNIYICSIFM